MLRRIKDVSLGPKLVKGDWRMWEANASVEAARLLGGLAFSAGNGCFDGAGIALLAHLVLLALNIQGKQ